MRVHASTVNRTDSGFRKPSPFFVRLFSGLLRPKHRVLGTEYAGVVEAVGADVTEFAAGDEVFGVHEGFGANAEYLCVKETTPIAHKPDGLSFEEAAAICDGFVLADACLRPAALDGGSRIMVYGASGSIGTAAVQLAKYAGAHVTAVCNTANLDVVRSLGADEVIDYTKEDFVREGDLYDVVFDAVGKTAFGHSKKALTARGLFIVTDFGPHWSNPPLVVWTMFVGERKVLLPLPKYTKDTVRRAKELVELGQYRAVVDRTYPLEQAVEATRYVETEQKTGNVVLKVISSET